MASIMGHTSEQITVEMYTHIIEDREQINAEELEGCVARMGW